jgi:deoxyadenosine/deoxycytidine kinase
MYKMPKSAERWYKLWINQFPESWHPSDLERFYMFVSVLNHASRTPRDRYWLEKNIRADNSKLSDSDVENYCDLFEHLRDYTNVWKSQQAKLIAIDSARKDLEDRIQKKK